MFKKSKAFTIVELLVVIVIVAILMAILLPALNSATRQANKLKCLANLGEIQKAFTLWKADANFGKYPVVLLDNVRQQPMAGFAADPEWDGDYMQYLPIPPGRYATQLAADPASAYGATAAEHALIARAAWFGFAGMPGIPASPLDPTANKFATRRILDEYLLSHEVLRCPSDKGSDVVGLDNVFGDATISVDTNPDPVVTQLQTIDIYRGSYVYNPCLGIVETDPTKNLPEITDANIRRPEITVTFADANIMDYLDDDGATGADDRQWHRSDGAYACAVFADGHAEEIEFTRGSHQLFGKDYKLDPLAILP